MVEKPDSGGDLRHAGAVEVEADLDIGFLVARLTVRCA